MKNRVGRKIRSVHRYRLASHAKPKQMAVLATKFTHTLHQGPVIPNIGSKLRRPAVKNVCRRYSSRQCLPQICSSFTRDSTPQR